MLTPAPNPDQATTADTSRDRIFFLQYLVLLVFALFWVRFPHVRPRVEGRLMAFYALDALAIVYVLCRAWLVLTGRRTGRWESAWLTVDLLIITGFINLTGGITSEAALIYFWPLATSSIQRSPTRTIFVGAASALLYVLGTWPGELSMDYAARLGTRLFILMLVAGLATVYALTEVKRVAEIARLREQVALADYRTRLSQEMHDGIQHYLVTITTRLELARHFMKSAPHQAAKMALDQRYTVRQAADELRYVVRRLRSPIIEERGFVEAATEHVQMFSQRSAIEAGIEMQGDIYPLSTDVEHAAFRVMQEALTNAEKYSDASELQVTVRFLPGLFECEIADNGAGFEPASQASEGSAIAGLGLTGMRDRAQSVNGSLAIDSAPGTGTKVTLSVPITGTPTPEDTPNAAA